MLAVAESWNSSVLPLEALTPHCLVTEVSNNSQAFFLFATKKLASISLPPVPDKILTEWLGICLYIESRLRYSELCCTWTPPSRLLLPCLLGMTLQLLPVGMVPKLRTTFSYCTIKQHTSNMLYGMASRNHTMCLCSLAMCAHGDDTVLWSCEGRRMLRPTEPGWFLPIFSLFMCIRILAAGAPPPKPTWSRPHNLRHHIWFFVI